MADKRPRNDDASYVAALNLQHGRKRFKLTCLRPPPLKESADQAFGTAGAKNGPTTKQSPATKFETNATKKTSKQASVEKNVKQTRNVTRTRHVIDDDDGDEMQILCQVFNRPRNKYVTLEGNKEVGYTLEKDSDVLQFVIEKQKQVRSSGENEMELVENDSSCSVDSSFLATKKHDMASNAETNVGNAEKGGDNKSRGEELAGATAVDESRSKDGVGATEEDETSTDEVLGIDTDDDDETSTDEELIKATEESIERRGEEPAVLVENKGTYDMSRLRKRTRGNIVNPLTHVEELNSFSEEDDNDDDDDVDTSVKIHKNTSTTSPKNTDGESQKNTRTRARKTDGEILKNTRTRARYVDGESKKNTWSSPRNDGEIQKTPITSSKNTDGEILKNQISSGKNTDPITSGKKTGKSAKLNAANVGRILANSLLDTEELLNITKELAPPIDKSKYKFRFPTDIPEPPVEKSEFEVENDKLFDLLNMSLTSEQIGSTAMEDNNGVQAGNGAQPGNDGAPITTETLCSQGKHYLLHKDPIGLVCKYCSHVELESRYMLPDFYKPRSRRPLKITASPQAERAEYPSLLDEMIGTGSENHGTKDYKDLETVWDLIPGTRRSLYEHQREGFEFIWKNLVGDTIIEKLEKPLSSSGHGCIISHAPGTGKTRLTIVFLQSFMKMYPDSRPIIVAPKSLLLTWEEEFRKWHLEVPFHNLNKPELTGHEFTAAANLWKKGKGSSKNSETDIRVIKLFSWKMSQSILGLTYQLFEHIVGAEARDPKCNPSVQQMGKALLKLPTVLVLDEGHTPRNNDSNIYRFLHTVETKRRIILSGTPFQNNFDELYNTLCLVNPEFEKTIPKNSNVANSKKNKKTGRDIQSKWSSLTNFGGHDGEKLRDLKALIGPFVHVHKGTILQENCPGLTDSMVLLRPTQLQQELIALLKEKAGANHFHYTRVMSIISVHPSLLPTEWFDHEDFSAYRDTIERLKTDPFGGTKTKFVIELCRMSQALNEKVVIFCQYLDPLDIIQNQLQAYFGWILGKEVLYIKGSLEPKQRQSCINAVNDPKSNVRVLLASIRACSEGIHLVGVSRVVLLDVVWNPSVERQAISRAYRIGQQKMVYTYHLIDKITEMDKYTKQLEKDRLSELVFSSTDESDNSKKQMPKVVSVDSFLQEMFERNEKLGNLIERICYNPKASNLADSFNAVAE